MPQLTAEFIAQGLIGYVVLLFSLTVHESAHGWMAWRMGDDTAVRMGRVSLNPAVHIDPVGTLLIPLIQIFGPGNIPLLGWAKPTPVGAHNFRRLAQGHVLVAGAGPVSNLALAFLFTALLFVAVRLGVVQTGEELSYAILTSGIKMNVALAVFNLVPLPPLDGSWIASWGLPREIANAYDRIAEPYGQWILLILFVTGILGWILRPFMILLTSLLYSLLRLFL
jgi:Zn-dependent protease